MGKCKDLCNFAKQHIAMNKQLGQFNYKICGMYQICSNQDLPKVGQGNTRMHYGEKAKPKEVI